MFQSVGRVRASLALLLCTLLTATALSAVSPAHAADDARISGRVADASAIGLAGVGVTVYRDDGKGGFESVRREETDVTGAYLVQGLPAGVYRLGFDAYASDLAPEYYSDATSLATATNVPVAAGALVQDVDVVLDPAAHLAGHVTGDGRPLRHVAVEVWTDAEGDDTWNAVRWGETDVHGNYDVGSLRAGSFRLRFTSYGGDWASEWYDNASSLGSATNVSVLEGQTVGGLDAALAPSSHITGTVTSPGSAPLSGVEVTVYSWQEGEWSEWRWDDTDASGGYDVGRLDTGSYRVGFWDPQGRYAPEYYDDDAELVSSDSVTVGISATTAGINASLAPAAVLSGRLTKPNGDPVRYADVWLYRLVGGDYVEYGYASSDEFGNYQARGLAAGTYRLEFVDWDWEVGEFWNNKGSLATADSVMVTAGQQVGGLDAVLDPAQGQWAVKNQVPPSITGTPQVGQTLMAGPGQWSPTGVTVTYQWLAGGVPIPGATGQAYNPKPADVGKSLQVRVAASRQYWWTGFAQSQLTTEVAPMPGATPVSKVIANTKRPAIKGVLEVGRKVRVDVGAWTPSPTTFKYRWFAGQSKIRKATKPKLILTSKLVGKRLTVRVTASSPGYPDLTVRTQRSAKVRR